MGSLTSVARRAAVTTSRALAPVAGVRRRRLARPLGRSCFVLSLDCDTTLDLEVVPAVHERLVAAGIVPTYAVPGSLLEAGHDVYAPLAAVGIEFVNHGYAEHCHIDPATGLYESSYFYDQLPWAEAEADIRRGHAAVAALVGRPPAGFRTPHFGTFRTRRQLARLHALLAELDYRYSSSTMPLYGLRHGPVVRVGDLWEVPVSGRPSVPHRVLDSWSFRYAPGRDVGPEDFERELRTLLAEARQSPAVVHVYADPSQVHDWPGFFDAVAEAAPLSLASLASLVDLAAA